MGFDTYSTIDCSTLQDDIENWNSNSGNAELVSSSPQHVVLSLQDKYDKWTSKSGREQTDDLEDYEYTLEAF
jgi:hypothetical protein